MHNITRSAGLVTIALDAQGEVVLKVPFRANPSGPRTTRLLQVNDYHEKGYVTIAEYDLDRNSREVVLRLDKTDFYRLRFNTMHIRTKDGNVETVTAGRNIYGLRSRE